jgi:8-oxo-dGTP pyrophosphatase MutT (NUDIX family)
MQLPVPVRRLAFRAAYWGLRAYWFALRPEIRGVKCSVRDGEKVLLVRHTYGPRYWDLPGGTMRRGERPERTARREMAEELGVVIDDWRALGELRSNAYFKRDIMHCFEGELAGRALAIDVGEIARAEWFDPGALPGDVGPHVASILARGR